MEINYTTLLQLFGIMIIFLISFVLIYLVINAVKEHKHSKKENEDLKDSQKLVKNVTYEALMQLVELKLVINQIKQDINEINQAIEIHSRDDINLIYPKVWLKEENDA
jgi:hypothetical protein